VFDSGIVATRDVGGSSGGARENREEILEALLVELELWWKLPQDRTELLRASSTGSAMIRSFRSARSPLSFCFILTTPIALHGMTTPGQVQPSNKTIASRGSPSAARVLGTKPQS
jgi:hypothetical protein